MSTTTKETHTSTGYQAVVEPPLIIYNPKIFPPTKFSVAKNLKLVSGYNIIERKKITMGAGRGSSTQSLWVSALLTLLVVDTIVYTLVHKF